MTAAKVVNFPHRRAAEAAPVYKLRAMQRVRELTAEGELLLRDMVVFEYIVEIIDKETGVAVVGRSTIAERVGCSRVTVTRSLRRLFDAGVLEHERRGRGKRCFANAYRIVDLRSKMNRDRLVDEPAPVHECTTFARGFEDPSPGCLNPDGHGPSHDHAQQDDEEAEAVEETWIKLG